MYRKLWGMITPLFLTPEPVHDQITHNNGFYHLTRPVHERRPAHVPLIIDRIKEPRKLITQIQTRHDIDAGSWRTARRYLLSE
jgi:hypothetical protein